MVEEIGISVNARHFGDGPHEAGALLNYAINAVSQELVCYLLEQGADPNEQAGNTYPPLAQALVINSMYSTYDIVQLLLEYGAEQQDFIHEGECYSPISFAMSQDDENMVELLEKHLG
jgi:ankyrin repeat protein